MMKLSKKQNYLETIRCGAPEALAVDWDGIANLRDPASGNSNITSRDPYYDRWGVKWGFTDEKVARSACVLPGGSPVKDITHWRDYVTIPNVEDIDFSRTVAEASQVDRSENLLCISCVQGLFERAHFLLGFEDCLADFLEEPEYMEEILDVITEHKLALLDRAYRELKMDAVFFHDDWGSKYSLFMSPATWREFIKPREAKIIAHVKSLGDGNILFIHHSDSFLEPLIPEMIEIGIDVWQGCIPQNDLVRLQKDFHGKIGFMGGIDIAAIDHADCPEEAVRAEVRRAIDTYAPHGGMVVGIPSIAALNRNVQDIYMDELRSYTAKYNAEHFGCTKG